MAIEYVYNEEQAVTADKAANVLNEGGGYVGVFKKAHAITASTGTQGIEFEFDSPGNGVANFTLYTQQEDGTPAFGSAFVSAIMYLMGGMKGLKSEVGEIEVYDAEAKARVKVQGETFPALCNKQIGVVLQKELYTNKQNNDAMRMSLIGLYQPETRLMMSELKENKTKAVKLDRLLKGLKVKDARKKGVEVAQPDMGGVAGDY